MTNPDQSRPYSAEELEAQYREALHIDLQSSFQALYPITQVLFNQLASATNAWQQAQGFWDNPNIGEKVALIHSELGEFTEAHRNGNPESEHIPNLSGCAEELADVILRTFDLAHFLHINLGEAVIAKAQFNLTSPFKHNKAY